MITGKTRAVGGTQAGATLVAQARVGTIVVCMVSASQSEPLPRKYSTEDRRTIVQARRADLRIWARMPSWTGRGRASPRTLRTTSAVRPMPSSVPSVPPSRRSYHCPSPSPGSRHADAGTLIGERFALLLSIPFS